MVPRRTIATVALVALVACTGGDSGRGANTPVDATFRRFDDSSTSFTAFRGKPLIVNFFSSTCAPCRTEMPALEAVHRSLGDQVTFLGMDVQDTVEGGKAFIATVGITWELGRDPDGALLQSLVKVLGLPTTVVLDRDGRIAFTHLGPLDVDGLTGKLRDHGLIM
jgi:cytochrome c biogenesis protein CcmG/thiol:disulfide interchange protein DsbE